MNSSHPQQERTRGFARVIGPFLAIVAAVVAVIVSLLGWLLVVRGIFLIGFPDSFASLADRMIGADGLWKAAYVAMALVGLYLTYAGWKPLRHASQSSAVHVGDDVPHPA